MLYTSIIFSELIYVSFKGKRFFNLLIGQTWDQIL